MTAARRSHPITFALVAAALVGVLLAVVFVACSPSEVKRAEAASLTSVYNAGTKPFYVATKAGPIPLAYPGQTVWGAYQINLQRRECIRINGGAEICASSTAARSVKLGLGSYRVVRTR